MHAHSQSCQNLCHPMGYSLPGSSVHGIFQATVLEWFAISFSRGSSRPRDWTQVSRIVSRRFTAWATRKAHRGVQSSIIFHGILVLISLCTRAGVSLTYSKIYSWVKGYTIFNFHRCYTNWCVCMVNVRVSVAFHFPDSHLHGAQMTCGSGWLLRRSLLS